MQVFDFIGRKMRKMACAKIDHNSIKRSFHDGLIYGKKKVTERPNHPRGWGGKLRVNGRKSKRIKGA